MLIRHFTSNSSRRYATLRRLVSRAILHMLDARENQPSNKYDYRWWATIGQAPVSRQSATRRSWTIFEKSTRYVTTHGRVSISKFHIKFQGRLHPLDRETFYPDYATCDCSPRTIFQSCPLHMHCQMLDSRESVLRAVCLEQRIRRY